MTIVFIEGLPAGGKTHLIRYIESRGHQVIHELGRVLKPEDFPGDGKTIEEILRIHDWFIEKEHARFEHKISGVFERSFMTQLGYAFAYPRYMNLDAFEKGVNKYASAIYSGSFNICGSSRATLFQNPSSPSFLRTVFISLMVFCWSFLFDILTNFIMRSFSSFANRNFTL